MKKLTYADLTHEILKDISAFTAAQQIIEYFREKDLEISEQGAERLLKQFEQARILSREALEKAAGGGKGYSGTRILSNAAKRFALDCRYDCIDRDWGECPNDEYLNCMSFHCYGYDPYEYDS